MIKNVGVVGAGQMGCGIAQVSAMAGYRVHIYDVSPERIETGLATINGNMARQVASGKLTDEDRKKALALIKGSVDLNDLSPPTSSSRLRRKTRRSSAGSMARSVRC